MRNHMELQVSMPSINIFLGSTPVYAALEVMHRLVELPEPDRHHVAIVFLDIAPAPAELKHFRDQHQGELLEYGTTLHIPGDVGLAQLSAEAAAHTFIKPHKPHADDTGAGGIRNNGHIAACFAHDQIAQTLNKAIFEVCRLPQHQRAQPVTEVIVNIVAFLGGGTGSGILTDLAVLARDRVAARVQHHRLNLFCLLPEDFPDVEAADFAQRRANSTASLLELTALSMKPQRDPKYQGGNHRNGYRKYLGRHGFDLQERVLANEVYLFSHTTQDSAEEAMRLIGIDLITRVTNASGVGHWELTEAVNRRDSLRVVDKGMPSFFGTSCPFEVVLPASEIATAFAELTAAGALRHLAGHRPSPAYPLTEEERAQVAAFRNLFQEPRVSFEDVAELARAEEEGLVDRLSARLEDQTGAIRAQDQQVLKETEIEQFIAITSMDGVPTLPDAMMKCERHLMIYRAALQEATATPAPEKLSLEPGLVWRMFRAWPIFGMRRRAVEAVAVDFEEVLENRIEQFRLEERRRLLERLIRHTTGFQDITTTMQREANAEVRATELESHAKASAAWNNRLEREHLHRRHIFDTETLATDGLSVIEALYKSLTAKLPAAYGEDFARTTVRHESYDSFQLHLEAHVYNWEPEELAPRLVEYLLETVYMPALAKMNLIDVLEVACKADGVDSKATVGKVLLEHLGYIKDLSRDLVSFQPHLTKNSIDTSLYMGLNTKPGQEEIVADAVDSIDLNPRREHSIDPHRMQVAVGHHGISLGIIRDFYRETDSSMGELLSREEAWRGNGKSTYGQSNWPVFSSTEMERLVMDPKAFDGSQTNLPDRILREGVLSEDEV